MVVISPQRPGSAEGVRAEVARLVTQASGVGAGRTLPLDEPLGALGLDSLAIVNAVTAVEAAYGRELPESLWADRRGISITSLAEALGQVSAGDRPAPAAAPPPVSCERSGVSRAERLVAQLEEGSPLGRVAAGALHAGVIGRHWAFARRSCVVLARDLCGDLPEVPLPAAIAVAPYDGRSDEPLAGIWPAIQARRMRAHLRDRMEAGVICLAAWEDEQIVAYDLLGPNGAEDVTTSNGTCFVLNLHERREARGRGIGLALLAASLPYTRELGFTRQATIVQERNRLMIAATTQILGFAVSGHAERTELFGRVSWSWHLHGSICQGPRLIV